MRKYEQGDAIEWVILAFLLIVITTYVHYLVDRYQTNKLIEKCAEQGKGVVANHKGCE